MKHVLAASLVLAGFATFAAGPVSAKTQWIFATPYAPTHFHTRNNQMFADEVRKATNGDVVIEIHPSGSLFAQPQIKRAVQTGQIQLGEINMTSYGNENPFFDVDSIPFVVTDYKSAYKLLEMTRPLLDKFFDEQNIVALYSVPFPPMGIISKNAINSIGDFKGLRVRAGGTATSLFSEMVGATPTVLQAAEVAQAFSLGTVDAQFTSASTGVSTQAWDYAGYFINTQQAHSKNMVMLNKKAFQALSKENQRAVLKASKEAEDRGWKMSAEEGDKTRETLAAKGMKIVNPSPEFKADMKKVSHRLFEEWAKKAGPDGGKILKELTE